ncbi:hypothetical protein SCHPADRAFT_757157 [Schizopora paradoxa]|uniref:Uncharacterized protein n=1 Tax=Schizopora paradoxa TaxID=27342 RepID=A0A0H2QY38_9AGAM|nr:hypothetical protein SCHPADRAFT_757157 [Schizopora paradoxa]
MISYRGGKKKTVAHTRTHDAEKEARPNNSEEENSERNTGSGPGRSPTSVSKSSRYFPLRHLNAHEERVIHRYPCNPNRFAFFEGRAPSPCRSKARRYEHKAGARDQVRTTRASTFPAGHLVMGVLPNHEQISGADTTESVYRFLRERYDGSGSGGRCSFGFSLSLPSTDPSHLVPIEFQSIQTIDLKGLHCRARWPDLYVFIRN